MTYQEIINNIRDLGFSDDVEMGEFGELVNNAINRSITEININVAPIIEKYEFEITEEDSGYLYITMPDIDENFLDFSDTPVLFAETHYVTEDGVRVTKTTEHYRRFNDFEIEADDTIVIDTDKLAIGRDAALSFRVFYKAQHEKFEGTNTQLLEEVPLPLKAHQLLPLLAAYYVWLEDDPSKASQYYNLYETKANEVLNSLNGNKIRLRVLAGGI